MTLQHCVRLLELPVKLLQLLQTSSEGSITRVSWVLTKPGLWRTPLTIPVRLVCDPLASMQTSQISSSN